MLPALKYIDKMGDNEDSFLGIIILLEHAMFINQSINEVFYNKTICHIQNLYFVV